MLQTYQTQKVLELRRRKTQAGNFYLTNSLKVHVRALNLYSIHLFSYIIMWKMLKMECVCCLKKPPFYILFCIFILVPSQIDKFFFVFFRVSGRAGLKRRCNE